MKLHTVLIGTHLLVAGLAAAICWAAASPNVLSAAIIGPTIAGSALIGTAVSRWLARSLQQIRQSALSDSELPARSSGVFEVDQLIEQMRVSAARWSDAAMSARKQSQELNQILDCIDRRASNQERSGNVVTRIEHTLGSLLSSSKADLEQVLHELVELQQSAEDVAAGTDDQAEAVNRTTTYVEQLSLQFDSVAENANSARAAAANAGELADSAKAMVVNHLHRFEGLRERVEGSERRLKALGERSQAINNIVGTIEAISSRTDLLALNASIESIRAGEQGRGFSVVADEVRKLAEQAALATREISALIEMIQVETEESIKAMAEQRQDVCQESERMNATKEQLDRITQTCAASGNGIQEISQVAARQLHLTQDLVIAVERISDVTRGNRSRIEKAGWSIRSLAKHIQQIDQLFDPLRQGLRLTYKPRIESDTERENSRVNTGCTPTFTHEADDELAAESQAAMAGAVD